MLMTLANLKTVTNEQKREVTELLTRFYHLFGGIYVSGLQMTTEGVLGAGSTILSIMMLRLAGLPHQLIPIFSGIKNVIRR